MGGIAMKGLLLRVGCDSTEKDGKWNPPINTETWEYVYVPMPGYEDDYEHIKFELSNYNQYIRSVQKFGVLFPERLTDKTPHLDPNFEALTVCEPHKPDQKRLSSCSLRLDKLEVGDFIIFYASFKPTQIWEFCLAYCLIGIFYVSKVRRVGELSDKEKLNCAHGRRRNSDDDLVIFGDRNTSGRLERAIPIGEFRDRAYRVSDTLLRKWGGLTINNGYLQRSANPLYFSDPEKFLVWFNKECEKNTITRSN